MVISALVCALLAGQNQAFYEEDKFTGNKMVSLTVNAVDVKSTEETLQSVSLIILTNVAQKPFPGLFFAYNGPFLFTTRHRVYLLIDGERFQMECEGSTSKGFYSIACMKAKNQNEVLQALRRAKTSIQVRTDLAEFTIPVDEFQRVVAEANRLFKEHL
jgi:hypothetical protein